MENQSINPAMDKLRSRFKVISEMIEKYSDKEEYYEVLAISSSMLLDLLSHEERVALISKRVEDLQEIRKMRYDFQYLLNYGKQLKKVPY